MRQSTRAIALLVMLIALTDCRGRWEWVEDRAVVAAPAVECRGGRVNLERRTTDVAVAGRTRNTVVRTDACLE